MEKAVWKLSPQLWNADLESSAIFLTFAFTKLRKECNLLEMSVG